MPRLVIRGALGDCYACDTADWDLLQRWLAEWIPRLHQNGEGMGVLALQVHPVFTGDKPDWPADIRFNEPFWLGPSARSAIDRLKIRHLEIEAKIREADRGN